jgi:hypothetical protein
MVKKVNLGPVFFCIKKTRALNYALAFVESYWQAS